MSKVYVFGIGGTGARVLRALTLLLASGVKCNSSIVPIIIDPDSNNGDLTRTVLLMQRYVAVRDKLNYDNSQQNQFYRTEILEEVENFMLPLSNTQNKSFEQYINFSDMNEANQALMKMLFSEKNLKSDMQVGFKGNPNIGSIVLNQFSESNRFADRFKEFANTFSQNDRIFIISSIFGGTGASGFPLLLKTLRDTVSLPNHAFLNQAIIGAITVLPYFTVKQSENSSILSETFISKTKSALSYYDRNICGNNFVNSLYYIGDTVKADGYENREGGHEQKNKAHLIEMLSALAVIDFAASSHQHQRIVCKEFGLEDGEEIIFKNFGNKTRDLIRKPLTAHMLFMRYMEHMDNNKKMKQQWARIRKLDRTFFESDFIRDLQYVQNEYRQWLEEMTGNPKKFTPFTLKESNLFGIVKGEPPRPVWNSLNRNYALFDDRLDRRKQHALSKEGSKEQQFMELFYRTTQQLMAEKFNF